MQHPELGNKYGASLKEGDPIKILRGGDPTSDDDGRGNWADATVISNSDAALTVKFSDDGQEVVPWKSGRIRGLDNK